MSEVSSAVAAAEVATSFEISQRLRRVIAASLLVLLAVLLFTSVRQESQTFDESNHLYAGFAYWKHGDFGRNPEHPPLAKLVASLPLLPMGLKEPAPRNFPYFKAQDFIQGAQFLYAADADAILLRARLMIGLFSIGLGLLVFFAAREMFGDLASLIALFLFVFEPNLLANGALVTTDMRWRCLFFASVYGFYRYVKEPSVSRLALCALAVAFAIVTKQSGALIFPVLVLLAVVALWTDSREVHRNRVLQLVYTLGVIGVFSYFFLWAIYGFRFAARPGELALIPSFVDYASRLTHPLQRNVILLCARHHLLPEAYLYGWVDILLISSSRATFVFGHLYSKGQWFFFPGVFLIKSTISLLVLLATGSLCADSRATARVAVHDCARGVVSGCRDRFDAEPWRASSSSDLPVLHGAGRRCGGLVRYAVGDRESCGGCSACADDGLVAAMFSRLPCLRERGCGWSVAQLSSSDRLECGLGPGAEVDEELSGSASDE